MHYAYPVTLEPDAEVGGFVVRFDDVPAVHTQGDDLDHALEQAEDALVVALSLYVDAGEPLPKPGPARGRPLVAVPARVAAKLALYEACRAEGLTKTALARRLAIPETEARRLLDLDHPTKMDRLERILRAFGLDLVVTTRRRAA
ncbi:MAG: type II toxin-antitoxin system HicB family antitoxin [Geminicoccaceae bacterium]|nr:MAG: type II toxin-antitoxin system HicB family antitoxin [Geminicoccaceae bacterium]